MFRETDVFMQQCQVCLAVTCVTPSHFATHDVALKNMGQSNVKSNAWHQSALDFTACTGDDPNVKWSSCGHHLLIIKHQIILSINTLH